MLFTQITPQMLYHCAPELRVRLEAERDGEMKDNDLTFEIQAALQVVKEDFSTVEENLQSLLGTGRITFETIWAIVPPNELVYMVDALNQPCVYRTARSATYSKNDGTVVFCINGRQVDCNGREMGWTWSRGIEIASFVGEKPITELKAYPLRFHSDPAGLRESLVERGRRRIRLHEQRFYEYSGTALHETTSPLGVHSTEKISVRIFQFAW